MDDLARFREEIDMVDKELMKLFQRRMNIVLEVAKYKEKNGLEVFHGKREEEVINKNLKEIENKDLLPYAKEMLFDLMNISKKYQLEFLENKK